MHGLMTALQWAYPWPKYVGWVAWILFLHTDSFWAKSLVSRTFSYLSFDGPCIGKEKGTANENENVTEKVRLWGCFHLKFLSWFSIFTVIRCGPSQIPVVFISLILNILVDRYQRTILVGGTWKLWMLSPPFISLAGIIKCQVADVHMKIPNYGLKNLWDLHSDIFQLTDLVGGNGISSSEYIH